MGARSVRNPPAIAGNAVSSGLLEAQPLPVFECGVDWLTCTSNEPNAGSRLHTLASRLIAAEAQSGVEVSPWTFEQFTGLNAGQVALGEGDNMVIVRLSSYLAKEHWRKFYHLCSSVSRIDYQVTVSGISDGPTFIRNRHDEALAFLAGWKRPPEVTLRDSNRTGPTLYLGTRKSAWFARVYDKWVESRLDDYAGCVRFEAQFNKRLAKAAAAEIYSSSQEAIAGMGLVQGLLERRGIGRPWSDGSALQLYCPRRASDAGKRLRWLQSQVAPAVQNLVERGRLDEVLSALRLDHLVQPK